MNTTDSVEQWKPVVGFEGLYSVSSSGQIRSERPRERGPLRQSLKGDAGHRYPGVRMVQVGGKITTHLTATLVAAAFIGPKPLGMQINHIDGNRTNNRVENLEYVTATRNEDHAITLGLKAWGKRHGMAKLTEEQVLVIYGSTQPARELAAKFNVSKGAIWGIRAGKTWRRLLGVPVPRAYSANREGE